MNGTARAQSKPFITAEARQAQPFTPRVSGGPTREVFGFATAGSLADPNIGYPSWNFNMLSTVAFFSIKTQWDGVLIADSAWSVWDSNVLKNLVATAHAHGVKVVVTLVNFDGSANQANICAALINRATTVLQIVNQVKAKGVDGVNIDYEGELATCPQPQANGQTNQTLLTALAHDLRAALDAVRSGYYLSIDTYSGSAAGSDGFFNIPNLSQYVDSFFVMAYDMDYYDWVTPGCNRMCLNPVSPLSGYGPYNDTIAATQYAAVAGASKTILGLPLYGRTACVASDGANAYPTRLLNAIDYVNASTESPSPYVQPGTYVSHRDSHDPAGLERWDTWYDPYNQCTREMYWDDAVSLGSKYNLINRMNLRGAGFWTLNYGGGSPELWDTLAAYFQTWSAGYAMDNTPAAWVAGQAQTFTVTVTNSGPYPWLSSGPNAVKLDLHFATSPGGSAQLQNWLNSYIFPLTADVPSGQSATLTVTLSAPMTAGPMYLEAEMFKNQLFWFQQWQPIPVTVAPQMWVSTYDLSQAPTTWVIGQTKSVQVKLTNTGNMPWPSGGSNPVELDMHFATGTGASPSGWLTSQIFPLPADVPVGQSATLTVNVTAPQTDGTMYLEASLFKDHQFWFQSFQPVSAIVYGAWGASYDTSKVPAAWGEGQSQTFQLTVTNQGSQAWPSGGTNPVELDLHFATASGGSAAMSSWLTSQIYPLTADVAPGSSVTLNVTATAPSGLSATFLEAQMFKNHQFWLPQWAPAAVTISPAWVAGYETCQMPTSWAPGKSQTFQITLSNQGALAWNATGANPVELDLHFATGTGSAPWAWLTSQVYPLTADVAPGSSTTLTVTATAPSTTGSLYLEAELFKNQQFWFDQFQPVGVSVGSSAWAANYNGCLTPKSWSPGQSQTYQVTLTNAGTQTWPSAGANPVQLDMHFTQVAGSTPSYWLTSQIFALPADVAPGSTATVSVMVTAPTSPTGSMYLEAELFKNQQFWFQQWQPVAVNVAPVWSASYDLSKAPTTWKAGASQTFAVTVTNTGNTPWPSTGYTEVDLDLHFTTTTGGSVQSAHWLTSQAFALQADVAPGATAIVSVTITAPANAGSVYLEAEMIKEHQFWFQQVQSVAVTVS